MNGNCSNFLDARAAKWRSEERVARRAVKKGPTRFCISRALEQFIKRGPCTYNGAERRCQEKSKSQKFHSPASHKTRALES